MITTAALEADASGRGIEADLLHAIDQDRNRIASHASVDEDDPSQAPDYSRTDLAVGGESISGLVGRQGNVWAARAQAGGLTVTVVGLTPWPISLRTCGAAARCSAGSRALPAASAGTTTMIDDQGRKIKSGMPPRTRPSSASLRHLAQPTS
jgi:hypothetical protein